MKYSIHKIETKLIHDLALCERYIRVSSEQLLSDAAMPPRSERFRDPPVERLLTAMWQQPPSNMRPKPGWRWLWRMYDLHPEHDDGLLIVYNPRIGIDGRYGLAQKAPPGVLPMFLGYYGSSLGWPMEFLHDVLCSLQMPWGHGSHWAREWVMFVSVRDHLPSYLVTS